MRTKANLQLINALRETARRLNNGADYNWCHMGRCNCGHLAQTITRMSPAEIHERALMKAGDWTNQTLEYCTATGYTIDHIIETMIEMGLTKDDIVHIERLSDQRVLQRIELDRRIGMDHKKREDVVLYMNTFASLLEDELIANTPDPSSLLETAVSKNKSDSSRKASERIVEKVPAI
ncbi:MAG: hypothetical protein LAT84_01605 [Balneolia bacterium]|nr:hypothetical protein [Balneolia bacterium]